MFQTYDFISKTKKKNKVKIKCCKIIKKDKDKFKDF